MVWKASIYLALIGPFRKCFKLKKRNKPPVSAPNMEQHMVRDRWVRWALWQLELFVLCHKVLFFFFRMQHCKKELQKKAASHTEMLCIWLPLLRVVLGSGPMPTSPASWLFSSLSLSLSPHAARNNGVYWEGQMAGLRHRLWSGSPSRKGILDSIVGWRHFLGGLTVKSHPHDSSPPAKSPSNAEILKKKKKIWFTIPYVITCL